MRLPTLETDRSLFCSLKEGLLYHTTLLPQTTLLQDRGKAGPPGHSKQRTQAPSLGLEFRPSPPLPTTTGSHSRHSFSSLLSKQSGSPSHCQAPGMHRPLLHMKLPGMLHSLVKLFPGSSWLSVREREKKWVVKHNDQSQRLEPWPSGKDWCSGQVRPLLGSFAFLGLFPHL